MNRDELAAVLRRARGRLSPSEVGLPAGDRRRVAGLRREEVAGLAGISVDYVVRLEQARGPQPSTSVIAALARALQLTDDERDELFHLAGSTPPLPGRIDLLVRASVHRLIDRLSDLPTLVISAKGDLLAWNKMAAALLGDWSCVPVKERNIIWQRFLGPSVERDPAKLGRVATTPEEDEETAAQSVASLRATAARYPQDPDLLRFIAELREGSPRFDRLWREGRSSPWRSHSKTIEHPSLGVIRLDCDTLHLPDSDQNMIVYSAPPQSPAAESLALLRVIGTQQLSLSKGTP